MEGKDLEYKLVLVGDGGVGKSALTIQFLQNYFVEQYDPTIEDQYRKECIINGQKIYLDILDTAGQEEYRSLLKQYIKYGQGFMIVFSVTSKSSFEEAKQFREQIFNAKHKKAFPIILVGNKTDLKKDRVVSKADAAALAKTWKVPYFETSAKDRINVDQSFYGLVKEIHCYKIMSDNVGGDSVVPFKDDPTGKDCSIM
ncbi:Ras-like protein rasC [Smittium mucronatum]|uniref:Ras-like protein rasC n=1 Tax=Smittium mucronatum TaxID=133383 RepID=A0A1R0H8W3_9FUNG|nr:Ras-like protein rasC [Smittium mucronatum]